MQYWWVSQNSTFTEESTGGYMWSPKQNRNGRRNHFYDNMTLVKTGDLVLSFASSKIKAIGIVTKTAYCAEKPQEFGAAGDVWLNDGWKVDVDYHFLKNTIRPADNIDRIRPLLPKKYAPLQANGHGNQAYLFAIPEDLFLLLSTLIGEEVDSVVNADFNTSITEQAEANIELAILSDNTLEHTTKEQLVKSRRGQGLFKSRVEVIERCCRITGVKERRHLIASHIKPWRDSTNQERLDGNNGLMLAPHIDHLFDKGYISFSEQGEVLKSSVLKQDILDLCNLKLDHVGIFNSKQQVYLSYHRKHIFKT